MVGFFYSTIRQLAIQQGALFVQPPQWASPRQTFRMTRLPSISTIPRGDKTDEEAEAIERVGTLVVNPLAVGRERLRPQPSFDLNDPLYLTYLTICFFTFLATVNASKFVFAIDLLSSEFDVTTSDAQYQVFFTLLAQGLGNIFWVALMRSIGKRPVYLLSLFLLMAANIGAAVAHGWIFLLISSIVSGFAASAGEATVPAVVADLFFVHQRGSTLMIFHMAISSGLFLGPLINSYVIQYSTWRVSCIWVAIAAGVTFIIVIFTIHETSYYNRDLISSSIIAFDPKRTFIKELSITRGYDKDSNYFRSILNIFAIISYPTVLWASLLIPAMLGYNTVIQQTVLAAFPFEPYNDSPSSVGLLFLSGLVGSALAIPLAGPLLDVVSSHFTSTRSCREPEYRLYILGIPGIIGPVGVLIFGLAIDTRAQWISAAIGIAMQAFGLTAIWNIVMTYTLDSYSEFAAESAGIVFATKGVMSALMVIYGYPAIPTDLTTPVQQRIAINGANAISVGWNTYEKLSQSCVQYGTSSDNLDSQACSTSSDTYATSRTYSNAVTLTGLTPATTYYYKIVSTNSSVEHFFSPRMTGDKTSFAMSIVIDLGVYGADGFTIEMDQTKRDTIPSVDPSLNHTTIARLAENINDYELVVHPGDFAYADDWYLKPKNLLDGVNAYEAILEQFYDQLAPIAGRKAYMASPGNHEADCEEIDYTTFLCPEGQKNFTDFMNRFGQTMPTAFSSTSSNATAKISANTAQQLAKPPFWYSFEYGMVHVVMFDTETDFADAPDGPGGSAGLDSGPFGAPNQQLQFLEADLASVDRSVTPWLIVGGHRPWYALGDEQCTACQTAFEPLFYKYGVDLAIFGHVHNSQRFQPIYNGVADPNGLNDPTAPMYIVAGGAGNIEGLSDLGSNVSYNAFAYAEDFSYATINFLDENHLRVEFIQSSTGDVLDTSVLYKSHTEAFVVQ
ncbi:hypothetical protein B7494_g5261 [Chlorociboria aeruginascens]|nr:hypothetical protein B7494_g5261 [Chlorociboria aeruginascens]